MSVIPETWKAEVEELQVGDQPHQFDKALSNSARSCLKKYTYSPEQ